MRVEIIPCLRDNYAFLLVSDGQAIVVDACETAPVLAAVEQTGARLVAVLATHHHHDHVGGNTDLVARWPGAEVYGHASDHARTPGLTKPLEHGARFSVAGFDFEALHVPGHTSGAITYVTTIAGARWAFTGDTMFLAGCGRLFEGTPAQMLHSLRDVIGALPDDTLIACGHEYTGSNLRFAQHVEPANADVAWRVQDASKRTTTVPSPLSLERKTNPFLRVDEPAVRAHLGLSATVPSADVFAALRKEKDNFR